MKSGENIRQVRCYNIAPCWPFSSKVKRASLSLRVMVTDSAMVMPIRSPHVERKSQSQWGHRGSFLHDTCPDSSLPPRKEVAVNKCTPFSFFLSSLHFLPLYFCFYFASQFLISVAVINHCRQDPLMNSKISGGNFMKKQDISRVSKHLLQIAIGYGSGSNKYPHILWHLSLQQVALNPSLLACAGLGKLASNNRVWQEKDINFRVEKLGRHPLTEVFEVTSTSDVDVINIKCVSSQWCCVINIKSCWCHTPADVNWQEDHLVFVALFPQSTISV